MEMKKECIWTPNAQFLQTVFGFDVCWCISQITPYYLKLYLAVGVLFISSSNISKTLFLEHLCTMTSISSFEKDSIVTTRDSFKNCILACKISNQTHTYFEKRKVPQTASGNFGQKWLFCKTYVLQNFGFFICDQDSWKARSK